MERGGHPEAELSNAAQLLACGAEENWGWGTPAGKQRVAARLNFIRACCRLQPNVRVLECGCGTGVFTRGLAATGATVVAVDIAPALLQQARRNCPAKNVTFTCDNLEAPQTLARESFDVICGVSVLHHLNLEKALPALHQLLKPGGAFSFSEPNLLCPINRYFVFTPDLERRRKNFVTPTEMAFRPQELRSALTAAGFEVLSLSHRDFLHPAVPRLLIAPFRAASWLAERTPLLRTWSGSLWIFARKTALPGTMTVCRQGNSCSE